MPVIIGGLKALSQMDPEWVKSLLTSTSSHASMLLVNGPIAKELQVNSQAACMGPGRQNRANLAIGRAYTLCLKNIGHWYPGQLDMDVLGHRPQVHRLHRRERGCQSLGTLPRRAGILRRGQRRHRLLHLWRN